MKFSLSQKLLFLCVVLFGGLFFLTPFFSFCVLCLLSGLALVFSLLGSAKNACPAPRKKRVFSVLQAGLLLFVSAMGLWFVFVQIRISRTAALPPDKDVDFVVVLGAKTNGDRPSPILQRRLDTALSYLDSHPHVPAVLCGGMGQDETHTEASVMAAVLIHGGVDPSRIYTEDRSSNTEENLKNAQAIILSLTSKDKPKILLVSSSFHLYRAGLICESLGMTPSYLAAPGSEKWLWEANYRIREFCGVVMWTLGWGYPSLS